MKFITVTLTFFSIVFSTTLYVSYDITATANVEYDQNSSSSDYDSGALSIGAENPISESVLIGACYDAVGMEFDGSDEGDQLFYVF